MIEGWDSNIEKTFSKGFARTSCNSISAMSTTTKEGPAFEAAITFEDVWMGFDEGQVLRGVTFQVQERETLILLGETGTGKTLTLKMAAGLLIPTSGSLIGLGNEVSARQRRELLA